MDEYFLKQFPHPVIIRKSVFEMDRDWKEIHQWCYEHVGPEWCFFNEIETKEAVFYFKDEKTALQFKITWG